MYDNRSTQKKYLLVRAKVKQEHTPLTAIRSLWRMYKMKIIIVSTLPLLSLMFNAANANDALIDEAEPIQQTVQSDSRMTWHEFRIRSSIYTRVHANMTDGGVITLWGLVSNPFDGDKLANLASRVNGATKVVNNTGMK